MATSISVKKSTDTDNALEIRDSGLYVPKSVQSITTDASLTGDGSTSSPLAVANPLAGYQTMSREQSAVLKNFYGGANQVRLSFSRQVNHLHIPASDGTTGAPGTLIMRWHNFMLQDKIDANDTHLEVIWSSDGDTSADRNFSGSGSGFINSLQGWAEGINTAAGQEIITSKSFTSAANNERSWDLTISTGERFPLIVKPRTFQWTFGDTWADSTMYADYVVLNWGPVRTNANGGTFWMHGQFDIRLQSGVFASNSSLPANP